MNTPIRYLHDCGPLSLVQQQHALMPILPTIPAIGLRAGVDSPLMTASEVPNPFKRRLLGVAGAAVFAGSVIIIYFFAPLSVIHVDVFNTSYDDSADLAVFTEGKRAKELRLEPRERATLTYRLTAGTYGFAFAWKFSSETSSMAEYTHFAGHSSANDGPFTVTVGHLDSERLSWNI